MVTMEQLGELAARIVGLDDEQFSIINLEIFQEADLETFSSVSAANYGLSSLRNVTQLKSVLRVVGREQISSGTTVDSHPFFFSLYPFIAFFAIEDADPDSLCLPFLPNRHSGSPPVTLRIAHVRVITLFSGRMVSTDTRLSRLWLAPRAWLA